MAAAAIDHFAQARMAARAEGLSPPEVIRLEWLLQGLAARGIAADDPRVPRYTAPLVERSRARERQVMRNDSPGIGAPPVAPPAERQNAKTAARRRWDRLKLALYALALGLCLPLASDAPPDADSGSVQVDAVQRPETTPAPPPPPPQAGTQDEVHYPALYWLLVGVAFCGCAAAFASPFAQVLARRRRRRLRSQSETDVGPLAKVAVAEARLRLFGGAAMVPALRKLRRYRVVPAGQVDTVASIRATIAAGGRVNIRYGKRRLSPEYLLLSEREHTQDHLGVVAQAWQARLHAAGIASSHYDFFGDPGLLRNAANPPEADPDPLEAVLARHEGAHVMVLMESFDAVDEARPMPDWAARMGEVSRAHLMNPRNAGQWSEPEDLLETFGIDSFAADPEGVGVLAERMDRDQDAANGADEDNDRGGARGQADLAAYLARHRDMLLSPIPPERETVAALMHNLETWLDKEAFDWLCALSLLPVVNQGFTAFVGLALHDRSIVTHERYLSIARLPWLRAATMPAWFRQALAEALSPLMRQRAAAAVAAWLDPPAGVPVDAASLMRLRREAEGKAHRKRLAARLEGGRHPVFADTLLVGTLRGQAPGEAGVALTGEVTEPSDPWWLWVQALALLVALALVAVTIARDREHAKYARLPTMFGMDFPEPRVGPSFVKKVPLPQATPRDPKPTPPPISPPQPPQTIPSPPDTIDTLNDSRPGPKIIATEIMVYIHIPSEDLRPNAEVLAARLQREVVDSLPVSVPDVRLVGTNSPNSAEIRCFSDVSCQRGDALAAKLPGNPPAVHRFLRGDLAKQPRSPDTLLELWLAPSSRSWLIENYPAQPTKGPTASIVAQVAPPKLVSTEIPVQALDLIARFEAPFMRLPKSALAPIGSYMIGYGHILSAEDYKRGSIVAGGRTFDFSNGLTEADARVILAADLAPAAAAVDEMVKVPLSENQRGALISFQYNTGQLGSSTLLRQINARNFDAVPAELRRWISNNGRPLQGLVQRREAEIALWMWNADGASATAN